MRVLVTGGLGYVGGRLVQHLADVQGHEVRLTANRPVEARPNWVSTHEVVDVDLGRATAGDLESALAGVDAVAHLAGLNVRQCAADPMRAIDINVRGTQALVAAAAAAGVGTFVHLSTAHVYGAPLAGRLDETVPPRPGHPYAWTRRAAEDIVLGTPAVGGTVFRLSNVVGAPRDAAADCWMLVACDLCRQAVDQGQLTLSGDGSEGRDFVCMSDTVEALSRALEGQADLNGGGLYNLGAGRTLRVADLADRIAAAAAERRLGRRPPVTTGPKRQEPPAAPLDYVVDRLAEAGFVPAGDLDRELDETLDACARFFGGE